jgi:hypothetical protein
MKKLSTVAFYIFVALILASALFTLSLMKRPLGPSLDLTIPDKLPGDRSFTSSSSFIQTQPTNAAKTCGNSGIMQILVTGISLPQNSSVHGVGVVRLVTVDFDELSVSTETKDVESQVTWTTKDGEEDLKLTEVYLRARDDAKGNNEEVVHRKATQELAQVVVDNYGFVPSHYVTVNPSAFVTIVDLIGGISVNGQSMSGEKALTYITEVEFGEDPIDRQNQVLQAIKEAALRPANLSNADELIKQARKLVITDLSVDQLRDLACVIEGGGHIQIY